MEVKQIYWSLKVNCIVARFLRLFSDIEFENLYFDHYLGFIHDRELLYVDHVFLEFCECKDLKWEEALDFYYSHLWDKMEWLNESLKGYELSFESRSTVK